MRDPHVEELHFELKTDKVLKFQSPPPLEIENPQFDLVVVKDSVAVTLHEHYATEAEARAAVGPFFAGWEIHYALRNQGRIRFEFVKSVIVDRDPPPPGTVQVILAEPLKLTVTFGEPTLTLGRATYPPPPACFAASPDVLSLWHRFENYEAGREPLQGMANFCLTLVENRFGPRNKRREASQLLCIEFRVLAELGRLISTVGDDLSIRKLSRGAERRPLTDKEAAWIDAAVRLLIRRLGEYGCDPEAELQMISMNDLPTM